MKAKRTKTAAVAVPETPEVPSGDHAALTGAYKSGLIVGWRRDTQRGYRLTLGDRRDDYVEVAKLTSYLEKLRKNSA